MNPTIRRLLVALILVVFAVFLAQRFLTHDVPAGQPPMATLDSGSIEALRSDFNRASDQVRILLLLAPT